MRTQKWDQRYMDLAKQVGSWSKDRGTKVGAVIVADAGQIIATGYNGFPRGVDDDVEARHQRPAKYQWTEHAERNAIYNAARSGVPTEGTTIYVPWFPCTDCTRAIIQSGIRLLVAYRPENDNPRWSEDFGVSLTMLTDAKVQIRWYTDE